jgi:hypothetical protein
MFSSLPKLADRAFVIGYLLPTLLFLCALAALFADQPQVQALMFSETQHWQKIVSLVVIIWAVSVFLQLVNTDLIKFLEGYEQPIKGSRALKAIQEAALDRLDSRIDQLWTKKIAELKLSKAE